MIDIDDSCPACGTNGLTRSWWDDQLRCSYPTCPDTRAAHRQRENERADVKAKIEQMTGRPARP